MSVQHAVSDHPIKLTSGPMPRVLVVTMQRDEGEVLDRWLAHYADLFGYRQLVIIDNDSTDPLTLSLLDEAEISGAAVIRQYAGRQDFEMKGAVVTTVIQSIEAQLKQKLGLVCDFVLPVDCDELLAVFTPDRISLAYDDIRAELVACLGIDDVLRVGMSMFNVPGRSGWFCPNRSFHKGFVRGGRLASLDKGFHVPCTTHGDAYRTTRFTYLHYHNVALPELHRKARMKLAEPYASCTDEAALRAYAQDASVPGNHLIADLLLGEAEYHAIYDGELRIRVLAQSDAGTLLRIGGETVRWDASAYLRLNPDVVAYGLGPLEHYMAWGWAEGRMLR